MTKTRGSSTNIGLQTVLAELSATLRSRLGPRFAGLWLYGSEARGEADIDSDIDLLLLLHGMERPGLEIDRIADILADFNLKYGVLLSVVPAEEAEFEHASGPFWRNVRREGYAA
jgi:predicted nucleotidyltransferase